MKIRVNTSSFQDVELSAHNTKEVTLAQLRRLISPGEYTVEILGVKYLAADEANWRHGSVGTDIIRVATPDDLAVVKAIKLVEASN